MSLIARHNPPEDCEALDQRELVALQAENYSVLPSRRREYIEGLAVYARAIREDSEVVHPSLDDVWPNMAYGHSGYSAYQNHDEGVSA